MAFFRSDEIYSSRLCSEAFSAVYSRPLSSVFSMIRLLRPPPPSTVPLESILSLLITLVQLQFNGEQNSPFEIHPICMTTAVLSLIIYLIVREASHWLPSNSLARLNLVSNLFAAIFRGTAFICIATILLPNKIKPYLYVSCSFILTAVTVYSIFKLLRRPPEEQTSIWRRMIRRAASPNAWFGLGNGEIQTEIWRPPV